MFKFLGKERCAVQVYGKLPLAKDYLRVGAGSGSGQMLRDWLDRAFSQGANAKDPLVLPWPAALIVGESWGQPLCAAAWPSGDSGNLRPFPFAAFVERKKKALLDDALAGFPVGSPVFDWLADAYAARDSHTDAKGFVEAMRKRELAIDGLVPFEAEKIDFATWTSALWPDDADQGLLGCLRALETLRRGSHRGPIRLPLVANLPVRPQVAAWLRLLAEMNLIGREMLPSLFFPLPERGPAQPEPAKEAPEGGEGDGSGESSESSDGSYGETDSSSDSDSSSYDSGSSDSLAADAPSEESPVDASTEDGSAPAEEPPAEPVTPTFLVVFRATPPPTDAIWMRPPTGKPPIRPGDLCPGEARVAASADPAAEGTPALAESLRGALAKLRGRLSG